MSFLFTQAEVIEGFFAGMLLCPFIFWAANRTHISGKAFGDAELRLKLIREIAPMITEGGSTDKENVLLEILKDISKGIPGSESRAKMLKAVESLERAVEIRRLSNRCVDGENRSEDPMARLEQLTKDLREARGAFDQKHQDLWGNASWNSADSGNLPSLYEGPMFCPSCAANVDAASKFCLQCGHDLKVDYPITNDGVVCVTSM